MSPEAHTIDPLVYARRWKTLGVLSLALVVIGLDNTVLNVALPSLQEHFDASSSTLQWMVDSYLLVFAGVLLTMGALGDRFGRKKALMAGMVLFGGASLAVLAVDGSGELIAVRAVMGLGAALIMPATLSIITNIFPAEERGKAIGVWAGMAAVGIGLGPLLGGVLLNWFSWNSVFLINVPIAAVALALSVRYVPESRDPKPGAFDLPGSALSTAALVLLVYSIIEAPSKGWANPLILGALGASAVLGLAFAAWELRNREPLLDVSYLRNPRFGVAALALSLASFALFGAIFALTLYMQFAHGYSALQAGAAMVPIAFGLVIGAGSSSKFVERFGTTNVVAAGLLGFAGLLASGLAWTPSMPYWPLGVWLFATALAMGLVMAPATESVMSAVPAAKAGVASAMNDVTRQVAGALGVAVVGSLITSFYASGIADDLPALSERARKTAEDSVGSAHAVAATLPPETGSQVVHAANVAFTDAMGIGFAVAAAFAIAAAVIVKRWLPSNRFPAARTGARTKPAAPRILAGARAR